MPEKHSFTLRQTDQARQAADMAVEHPGEVFLRLVAPLTKRPASRMPSRAELARAALGIILRLVAWWIGLFYAKVGAMQLDLTDAPVRSFLPAIKHDPGR